MKETIKNSIIPITLLYMVIIIVLAVITYLNSTSKITLYSLENFESDINNYKKEIDNISDYKCKKYFNSLINYVEKTNYNGDVLIQDYYKRLYISNETLLGFYSKGKESCDKLTDEKMQDKGLPLLFLTASMQDDEIISHYAYQYELNLKDKLVRIITEPNLTNTENNIKQNTELDIIKNMIEIIKEEEVTNEE